MHSLTSALDKGEWSASRPGRFTPNERDSGMLWIGGWVGPSIGLDTRFQNVSKLSQNLHIRRATSVVL
jgi:hypothetical protein